MHTVGWLLAIAGVFLTVLTLQVVGSTVAMMVIMMSHAAWGKPVVVLSDNEWLSISIVMQLLWLAVALPWWRHVRKRAIGLKGGASAEKGSLRSNIVRVLGALAGLLLLGIGIQIVIGFLLGIILSLLPELAAEYDELMSSAGTDTFTVLSALTVTILAPIVEELTFRGIAFQFALRAAVPGWSGKAGREACGSIAPTRRQLWIANALQALAFGIMHLNIVQGVYAFAIGMVLGWMVMRTGRLRYGMGLHLAVNLSSYFAADLMSAFGVAGLAGELALPVLCLWGGTRLLRRFVLREGDSLRHPGASSVPTR